MNAEEQIKKGMKLMARKQHYYAINSMLLSCIRNTEKAHNTAMKILEEDGDTSRIKEAITPLLEESLPIYRLAVSLRSYKQAFGEYPEWTKFIEMHGLKEGKSLEKFIEDAHQVVNAFPKAENGFDMAPKLREAAFGKRYVDVAEKVKLKGEV